MKRAGTFGGLSLGLLAGSTGTYLSLKRNEEEQPSVKTHQIETDKKDLFKYGRPVSPVSFHCYKSHCLEYDRVRKIPVWVMERLTREDNLKKEIADRKLSHFKSDTSLPTMYTAANTDYRGSGWSRGHMAAAGNYKYSQESMDDTFYLTNILPQNYHNNSNYWYRLEKYCRQLSKSYDVTIISGPLFLPSNKRITHKVIGENTVSVPTHLFKVVLAENNTTPPLLGAFIIPNHDIEDGLLTSYQVSLEEVEKQSGTIFLQNLQRHKALDLCKENGCQLMSLKELHLFRSLQELRHADSKEKVDKICADMESKGIKPDEQFNKVLKLKLQELQS